ncbi:TPA: type I restriction-modification system subunit M [Vibrio parahaemolyticus]|uniref:type I restriction-modification system subunit M n=1 Tax=Vibrio parahaemolyticus TaxID=670 RepID=UPI00084A7897|nr:type I restriction-modification system subunit M [Vibrio parahaemolyticus]EJL6399050.1 type I restriction-modification system subunit M [Vibrio navarrensis]EGQ8500557.1 type I restriction-modification system subunit M [Vibrio parahaemolyticus]EJG2002354.1 type I restriction-modification system subunit M [Vibrio parahaemolyticus]EJG2039840.1 type I restriction-modification system subunit M [Vibrio parahaemolyticus]EJG2043976.1 type I restriction-modification system subunit M [Vibrio parahaem
MSKDLESINKVILKACDSFRGTMDPFNYKDFVLTMLFLKFISDLQKSEHEGHKYVNTELEDCLSFNIPKGCSFWDLYEMRSEPDIGYRIDAALDSLEKANAELQGVFQNISFNSDKLGDEKRKSEVLCQLLQSFANYVLDFSSSGISSFELAGEVYEYLIRHFATESGKKSGEFYTPIEVSELLSMLLEPQKGEMICDPTCGSGSLLIRCGQQIQRNFEGSKKYHLYGQELNSSTWSLAKMNMLLHGEFNSRIEWGDTIRNPKLLDDDGDLLKFDVVTAHPPFSLSSWGYEGAHSDVFNRFNRGIPPKTKGDYAFILHIIETLKPKTGRMAVVVPHGVLFRSAAEGHIRQKLIEENLIDTVIGLPGKLFFGTGIPVAILIFKTCKQDTSVLFIDASREFNPGKNQNELTKEGIERIVDTYRARQSVDKYAYRASIDEIIDNGYNLNIPRYVDTFEDNNEVDLIAAKKERLELQQKLEDLEFQMDKHLKMFGL